MALTLTRDSIINILTVLIALAWLIVFVLRLFHPVDAGPVLDTAMLAVISFWFGNKALKPTNGKPEPAPAPPAATDGATP